MSRCRACNKQHSPEEIRFFVPKDEDGIPLELHQESLCRGCLSWVYNSLPSSTSDEPFMAIHTRDHDGFEMDAES